MSALGNSPRRKASFAVAAVIAIAAISYLLAADWYTHGFEVDVHWPTHLRHADETHLAVSVHERGGGPAAGTTVEIGYVRRDSTDEPFTGVNFETGEYHTAADSVASKALSDEGYEVLATAETDDSGQASLHIPPVESFRAVPLDESDGPAYLTLVLEIGDGLDRQVSYVSLPAPAATRVHLTTDRPLYQPGQRIQMRALLFEASTGRPPQDARGARGAAAEFTVSGPRGNLLSRERALVSPAGVAAHAFELAPDCQHGSYALTVDYRGTKRTKVIDVRPYEKPRFDVELDTASFEAVAGGKLSGSVRAEYFYGEPVTGADVSLEVRAAGPTADKADLLQQTTGTLDADGQLAFELQLPDDLDQARISGRVAVSATVTDPSGRVRRAQRILERAEDGLQIEVLPARSTKFRLGAKNRGVVVVRDDRGAPLTGVEIEVGVGEGANERWLTATTDQNGTAAFDWTLEIPSELTHAGALTPRDQLNLTDTVRVAVLTDGARIQKDVPIAVAPASSVIITPETPAPRAGDTLSFDLELPAPSARHRLSKTIAVVAIHEGTTVASTRLDVPVERTVEGTIELGPAARGLTNLVALDQRSRPVGAATLWVRQKGGNDVSVALDDTPRRPGDNTNIGLSFPAHSESDTSAGQPPVTFGVWAVDEALYALKERTDLPLPLLARQSAETIAAVSPALGYLAGRDGAPNLTAARLARDAGWLEPGGSVEMRPLNHEFERHLKRPWQIIWSVFLAGLILVFLGLETIRARKHFDGNVSLRALGSAFVGTPLAICAVLFLIAAAPSRIAEMLAVLFGVAGSLLVVIGWVDGAVGEPDLQFWRWPLVLAASIGGLFMLVAVFEYGEPPVPDLLILAAVGAGLLMLIAQALMWMVTMWARSRHVASFATMVPLWGLVILVVSSFFVFGARSEKKFMAAESAVDSQVTFGDGSASREVLDRYVELAAEEAEEAEEAAEGPPASGERSSRQREKDAPLRVRDFFPDTMLWQPEVASDADGRASIDVQLPDSITTWRVHAVASTPDGRFGEGHARLEVRQPFFVELDLPTQLIQGDRLHIPVALVDGRRKPQGATAIEVQAEADGALQVDAPAQSIELPAGGRRVVWVAVTAGSIGDGSLTVRAHLRGDGGAGSVSRGDAVRREVRVVADGRRRTQTYGSIIDANWKTKLTVPDDAIAATASARVDILPGATAAAIEGLDALLRQPHGCFEQTTAIAFPNLMVLRALDRSAPEDWPEGAEAHRRARKQALRLVSNGYQRILTFQSAAGGFGLYPNQEPEVILTAFGLLQLAQIQQALEVDPGPAMRSAADWLVSRQDKDGTWRFDDPVGADGSGRVARVRATAFVVWALSQLPMAADYEDAIDRGADALTVQVEAREMGTYEYALAANALTAAKRQHDTIRLLEQLAKVSTRRDKLRYWKGERPTWTGARDVYADIATTALAARAMARNEVHPALTTGAMAFLASARQGRGGWGTTEATVWALDAMGSVVNKSTDPVSLTVRANGRPMNQADGTPVAHRLRVIPERGVPHTLYAGLERGTHRFSVAPSDDTGVIAQATAEYVVPWTSPDARVADEPFDVSLGLASRSWKVGERVPVEVTLGNQTGGDVGATIVELPIPPGAWADTAKLEARVASNQVDRVERTPTHLVVYLPEVKDDARVALEYTLVPRMGGDYRLPPVVAYPYYNPEPATERAGGAVRVRR